MVTTGLKVGRPWVGLVPAGSWRRASRHGRAGEPRAALEVFGCCDAISGTGVGALAPTGSVGHRSVPRRVPLSARRRVSLSWRDRIRWWSFSVVVVLTGLGGWSRPGLEEFATRRSDPVLTVAGDPLSSRFARRTFRVRPAVWAAGRSGGMGRCVYRRHAGWPQVRSSNPA